MTIQRAGLLYDQHRYDLAADEARAVLASDPDDAFAHALLSLSLTRLERAEEATAEAEAAIGRMPDLPVAHAAHAYALLARNRFARARHAAVEAIRLEPTDPDHYALLAQVDLSNRKWAAAYEATTQGLAIVADHAELLRARSVAATHLGRLEEAEGSVKASLRSMPDEPFALATRGYQQMHAGRFADARATFTNVLQLDPSNQLAQSGLVETIKATNPLYRALLRYFLWMSRLPTWQQFLVIFGGPAIFRSIRNTLQADPSTEWLVGPLVGIWLVFILSTWLAVPLSNLVLFLHPLGRHALDEDERLEATIIGVLMATAIAGVAVLLAGIEAGLFLAIIAAATALPTAAAFRSAPGWPRYVLGGLAAVVAVTGAAATTLAFIRPEGIGEGSPAWIAFGASVLIAILTTWAAPFLTRVQPAR